MCAYGQVHKDVMYMCVKFHDEIPSFYLAVILGVFHDYKFVLLFSRYFIMKIWTHVHYVSGYMCICWNVKAWFENFKIKASILHLLLKSALFICQFVDLITYPSDLWRPVTVIRSSSRAVVYISISMQGNDAWHTSVVLGLCSWRHDQCVEMVGEGHVDIL